MDDFVDKGHRERIEILSEAIYEVFEPRILFIKRFYDMVYIYAIEKEGVKMVRTQIYLNQIIKKELNRISQNRRVTVSELIRQAIEQFLQKGSPKFDEALKKSFGLWSGRKDIDDTSTYVRKARQEWAKREQRVKR